MIIPAREIAARQRYSTKFADGVIRITQLTMKKSDGKTASAAVTYTGSTKRSAELELEQNPLILSLADKTVGECLRDILSTVKTAYFRPFQSEIANDPALDAGDYVRLRGGSIDTNRGYGTGIITHNVWIYRGKHRIVNVGSVPAMYQLDDESSAAEIAAFSEIAPLSANSEDDGGSDDVDGTDLVYVPPKSQLEKEIDGLRGKTVSGGVGKAVEGFPTSEYFNDYKNHFIHGDYSHVEGEGNKVVGSFVHIEGKGNTAMNGGNCNHIEGEGNNLQGDHSHIGGKNNTLGFGTSNHMSGSGNSAVNPNCSTIGGQNNKISVMISNSLVNGLNNVIKECYQSLVLGSDNNVAQISGTVVAGSGNKGSKTTGITAKDSAVFGTDNIIAAPNTRVLVFGQGLKTATTNAGEVIVTLGKYNSDIQYVGGQTQRSHVVFMIGNGTSDEARSSGFLIDELGNVYCNRVYETGSSNIEDFLSGNTAQAVQAAQAITAAADAGIPIVLLDHAPAAEDLTGSPCVFLQCEDTAEVEGENTGIFRVTDIFAEKSLR